MDVKRRPKSTLFLSSGCSAKAAVLLFAISGCHLSSQCAPPATAPGTQATSQGQESATAPQSPPGGATPDAQASGSPPQASGDAAQSASPPAPGQQTKRILGIMPNFQAVSANSHPPPMSASDKFWLTTESTFDYSSFISVGMQAGFVQATDSYPEFHEGAAAYGRYYWHTFADAGVENYLVGGIFPVITHEDPRYYTLDRGGFLRRTRYAVSRLWITRNDKGGETLNVSEILGSGVAAEVSGRYYPRQERGAEKTFERWVSQFLNDGASNILQEFWPDIRQRFVHRPWFYRRGH
jgi:hypothetical protein